MKSVFCQVQHKLVERQRSNNISSTNNVSCQLHLAMQSYLISQVPRDPVTCRDDVKPGTFQARDNVSNFISWCRQLGVPEVLRFETDDLVMRKNEKNVILCLLELARIGAKIGMVVPLLVQMEQEIDGEMDSCKQMPQIKTCDLKSLDELVSATHFFLLRLSKCNTEMEKLHALYDNFRCCTSG